MKPGQGKTKGSEWEREVGRQLSLWLSNGERNDLFRRTVLSGGQFTIGEGKKGEPGDLGPNHPLAFKFTEKFVVECKAWKYLELIDVIWGTGEGSETEGNMLYKALQKVKKEARDSNKYWMLIAKQNHRPTLIFLAHYFQPGLALALTPALQFHIHSLFNGEILLLKFDDFLKHCKSEYIL